MVEELRSRGIGNWAVREFVQGQRTRRWGVGWSFSGRRPGEEAARGVGAGVERRLLPVSVERGFEVKGKGVEEVGERVQGVLGGLEGVRCEFRREIEAGVGFAKGNVWSRAARRRMMREGMEGDGGGGDGGSGDEEEWALGFKIQLRMSGEGGGTDVNVRWLLGRDSVLFESFCGMLKRQIS